MRMSSRPWVVKVGGRLCEDPRVRAELATACARLNQPLVLVHGGGCMVTDLQARFGVTPRFHEGRRVTDASDMTVVEMALSGTINKDLVRALGDAGRVAVGLSGCDANLVRCSLVPDLGAVGEPMRVDTTALVALLNAGFTPVVSPVSLGPSGEPVNVNADEMACAVAESLGAARLLLLSDVSAVRVGGADQAAIADGNVEALILLGEIQGGMIPKLRAAARAVRAGVGEVRIAGFGAVLADIVGTMVYPQGRRVVDSTAHALTQPATWPQAS